MRRPLRTVALVVTIALGATTTAACTGGGDDPRPGGADASAPAPDCPDISVLGCPVRAASAAIPILGTPFSLRYDSDRDVRALGLGGWALDVQDTYDPESSVLHAGSGDVRRVDAIEVGDRLLVASPDGVAVGEFTSGGRHVRTLETLTGVPLVRLTYDDDDRLESVTDRHDRATTIDRDGEGRPVAIVSPDGLRTDVAVDEDGFLVVAAGPTGARWTMQYAAGGLLASFTDGASRSSTFTYDDDGRLAKAVDPFGRETTYGGDDGDISVTTSSGRTVRWKVESVDGGTRIAISEQDRTWEERIDGADHVLTGSDGTRVELRLGDDPRFGAQTPVVERVRITAPGGVDRTTTTSVEAELDDPDDPRTARSVVVTTTSGTATAVAGWDRATSTMTRTDAAGVVRTVTFDAHADVIGSTGPGTTPTVIEYDAKGRPTAWSSGDRRTSVAWNDDVGEAAVTGPDGRVTRFTGATTGGVATVVRPDGTRVTVERSVAGYPTALRVNGQQVLTQAWSPTGDLIATGFGAGLSLNTRGLGPDGLTTAIHGEDGDVVPEYESGQVVRVGLPDGAILLDRDPATGRLLRVEDTTTGFVTEAIVEDGAVRGIRQAGAEVVWEADDSGRVTEQTVSTGDDTSTVAYQHDDAGRIVAAGDLTVGYDDAGRVATSQVGQLRSEREYDDHGELVAERHVSDAGPVYEARYTYDLAGRMTGRSTSGGRAAAGAATYEYDAAGRLVAATQNGAAAYRYEYDGLDRLTSITTPAGTELLTYGADGRVATRGDTTYVWSQSGNLRSRTTPEGTTTFETDVLGRLRAARPPDGTEIGYVLDEHGRVAERTEDGVSQRFVYDEQGRLVAELGPDGQVVRRYVYENGPYAALVITDNGTFRIVRDAAGNPIGAVNVATGEWVETIDYDPMGRETRVGEAVLGTGYHDGLVDPDTSVYIPSLSGPYDPGIGGPIADAPIWCCGPSLPDPGRPAAPGGTAAPTGGGVAGSTDAFGGGGLSVSPYSNGNSPDLGLGSLGSGGPLPAGGQPDLGAFLSGLGALTGGLVGGLADLYKAMFSDSDVRGMGFEVFGQALAALANLTAGLLGKSLALGSTFTGAVSGIAALADLMQDLPKIFDSKTSTVDKVGLSIKSVGSLASLIASTGAFGIGIGELLGVELLGLAPIVFTGLAIAAAAAAAIYLGYEFGRLLSLWGDPHLTTAGGLVYDFQGVGEYVALRASDGSFELQTRHGPRGDDRRVSVITALAARIGGAQVMVTPQALHVDGVPVDLPSGTVGLPDGGLVQRHADGSLTIVDGARAAGIEVRAYGDALDLSVGTTERYEGQLVGLSGDGDGDGLRARDGTVVEPEQGDFTVPLYAVFGDSWRVTPDESLFDYEPATTTETFTDRQYPSVGATVDSLSPADRERAEQLCRGAGIVDERFLEACILDVGTTGDAGFVAASAHADSSARESAAAGPTPPKSGTVELGSFEGDAGTGHDRYTFEVPSGVEGVVVVPADPCPGGIVYVLGPGDEGLGGTLVCEGGRVDLPGPGTYGLDVTSGPYAFKLEAAPDTTVKGIEVGDTVAGELDDFGERHEYRFEGTNGDAVYLDTPAPAASCEVIATLSSPNGTKVHSGGACLPPGRFLLEETGTYRLTVSTVLDTGPYRLALLRSSPDEHFTMAVGDTVSGTLDRVGAVDIYSVEAPPGQMLVIHGLGGECGIGVRPWEPGVGSLQGLGFVCGDLPFTAPASGRIEIAVAAASGPLTGSYSFRLDEG